MATDVSPEERKARAARLQGKTRLGASDPYYDYHGGFWYDRAGNVTGYAANEDDEPVPVGGGGASKSWVHAQRAGYRRDGKTETTDVALYTGEELAKTVTPDAALPKDETTVDDVDAEKILAKRLSALAVSDTIGAPGPGNVVNYRDIAEVIIDALPLEMHNVTTLGVIDLRPYMKALEGKRILTRQVDAMGPLSTHGEAEGTVGKVDLWIQAETVNLGLKGGAVDYQPGTAAAVLPTPEEAAASGVGLDPNDPGATTSPYTVDENGNVVFTSGGSAGQSLSFPTEELRTLVNAGYYDLEQLGAKEIELQQPDSPQYVPGGYFPVDVGKHSASPEATGKATGMLHTETISVVDAMNYVQGLKPAEVHALQLKLGAAGYFDRLESGGAYTDSYALDENTNKAWRLLLLDSVKENRSAPALLGEKLKTYREEQRSSRMRQLSQFDPTYVDSITNDFAQANIGRDFTPEEAAQVRGMMSKLRYQRAGYVAGDPGNTADTALQGPFGFDTADIESAAAKLPGVQWEEAVKGQGERLYRLKQVLG